MVVHYRRAQHPYASRTRRKRNGRDPEDGTQLPTKLRCQQIRGIALRDTKAHRSLWIATGGGLNLGNIARPQARGEHRRVAGGDFAQS